MVDEVHKIHKFSSITILITRCTRVASFDDMVFCIPHGWLKLDEITLETLLESLELTQEVFGVMMVVIPTLYFNNNGKTENMMDLAHVNAMISDVAWKKAVTGGPTSLGVGIWILCGPAH